MIAIGVRKGSHEPEQFDVGRPEAGEGEVLVRTLRVGICGTDREILEGGDARVPEGEEFLILGHEALGRVEAVGRGVSGIREGQLVAPSVRRSSLMVRTTASAEPIPSLQTRAMRLSRLTTWPGRSASAMRVAPARDERRCTPSGRWTWPATGSMTTSPRRNP